MRIATKIEVYGYGLSFSLTEITPKAKELTETGIANEDFDELELNELEDTDEDESGITLNLEVHVDGQKIANPMRGTLRSIMQKTCVPISLVSKANDIT